MSKLSPKIAGNRFITFEDMGDNTPISLSELPDPTVEADFCSSPEKPFSGNFYEDYVERHQRVTLRQLEKLQRIY